MTTIICSCVNALRMADPHCDECDGTGNVEYSDEELPIEYCEEEPPSLSTALPLYLWPEPTRSYFAERFSATCGLNSVARGAAADGTGELPYSEELLPIEYEIEAEE